MSSSKKTLQRCTHCIFGLTDRQHSIGIKLISICFQLYWGVKVGTWNLYEAGHGKGAADNIGGVLKRIADWLVAQGSDICDASSFYTLVQSETDKIPLFFVDEIEFETSNIEIPPGIASTAGTMN